MATILRSSRLEASAITREAPRRSSSMHKLMIARLRPLPFQYVWTVWHSKPNPTGDDDLTQLFDKISDIAAFYRVYNNLPWNEIKLKNSIHFFRAGVKPLWEHEDNLNGGCLVIKVRKDSNRSERLWEEICLICCGGELQAALALERDHVLGMSYSPRLFWIHISIWTKRGDNPESIETTKRTVLSALSPDLRPHSDSEYYYKKHSEHEGWSQAIQNSSLELK